MSNRQANKMLALSTISFAIAFAVWGMIGPMAKTFQTVLHLNEVQTWILIAFPVLLGSLLRVPAGMLADRFGGRIVLGLLLVFIPLPALLLSFAHSYRIFLIGALLLGTAGASFSVGIAFSSKWFPSQRQGFALGIFGAGNIGQSLALWGVPLLASLWNWQMAYRLFAGLALLWGIVFLLFARNAPVQAQRKGLGQMLRVFYEQPLSWLLGLFYFVTFGGFVALSIGLPKLLQEIFQLTREDAGLRVAGFVLLATVMRPTGGWVSDKIGGARVLAIVFLGSGLLAWGMTVEQMVPFTVGALGVAVCIGLGNGAVFKLVPQYFPKDIGTVTGLVGAMGGLGGFFPPLVLGIVKTNTGAYDLGFVFLSAFCLMCLALSYFVFLRPTRKVERRALVLRPGNERVPGQGGKLAVNLRAGAVISIVITIVGVMALYNPRYYRWIGDQTGYSPPQPIEFSHKTHAKDNSIPCEFCHFSARKGPVAGIPSANVCMNCHSEVGKDLPEVKKIAAAIESSRPIEWVRVYDLQDFAYFDHSAHLNKGVTCQTCHGRVEEMARLEQVRHLSMGWCVGCHRRYTAHPPKGVEDVRASAECSTCHF